MDEQTHEVLLTRNQTRRVATYAIMHSDWDLLHTLEKVLPKFGDPPPMDIYVEVDKLKREARRR